MNVLFFGSLVLCFIAMVLQFAAAVFKKEKLGARGLAPLPRGLCRADGLSRCARDRREAHSAVQPV